MTSLRDKLPRLADLDAAAADVKEELLGLMGTWSSQLDAALDEAKQLVSREYEFVLLRRYSIKTPRKEWYTGPKIGDRQWPSLKSYLVDTKGWDEITTVASIDASSSEVVSLLDDPRLERFLCRGLVVGYVQSGKTANMTAVIAKAVDSGYNFVVVLAGVTDKLRQQTQRRIEKDLVQRQPSAWKRLTTERLDGEFQTPAQGHLEALNKVQLAVMKKNVAPLQRLLECITETPAAEMSRIRLLLIDDECDQAGVNAATSDAYMTGINERLRLILKRAPTISYVGYTATPFANILINPYAEQTQILDDLYPKDFITALPYPEGYFGTRSIFGLPPQDPANPRSDEEGLSMLRDVPDTDEALLQPASRKNQAGFEPSMAGSLQDALLYFICTCAARRARGQAGEHMTMLIHTSAYVIMHERIAELVNDWLALNGKSIAATKGEIGAQLKRVWEGEQGRLPTGITKAEPITFDQLAPFLPDVIKALSVPIENGSSDDRIDYTGKPKTYVVVGGSILARGLTLDGLVVSFFLRSSNQYDTLLQMGRWFGYREGYEDMPRIWMPRSMQVRFRLLAAIEEEIRADMLAYSRSPSITPMDVAVRIRSVPGMAIVGRSRMRHAKRSSVGYWGRHVQTIRFPRINDKLLGDNWLAGGTLISAAAIRGKRDDIGGRVIFRDVPRQAVLTFFRSYVIDPSHQDLRSEHLLSFLEQNDDKLLNWNIGVVQAADGAKSTKPLGPLSEIRMVKRSRLDSSVDDLADIKALMSKVDAAFDCPDDKVDQQLDWEQLKSERRKVVGDRPLLLLYPIDKASPARPGTKSRVALDAVVDVLGFGLVFPGSKEYSGTFVSVELQPLSQEELEEQDAEEAEALRAAGVDCA